MDRLRIPGTAEPRYDPPDDAMMRSAAAWAEPDRSGARFAAVVESLPGPRNRMHAPEAMAATDALLVDAWRAAGWRTGRQQLRLRNLKARLDYPDAGSGGRHPVHVYPELDGTNLVAIAEGETDEAIVVVAHHDTVRDSPGADDNGAGLAALLELATLFEGRRFRRTVILAAPDFEEIGLIGSRYLVRWLRSRYRVRAAVVYDPIGYMNAAPGSQLVPAGIDRLYPGQVARLAERGNAGDTVVALYRRVSVQLVREWARCLSATIGPERILQLRDPLDLPVVGPRADGRAGGAQLQSQRPRAVLAGRAAGDPGHQHRQLPQPELPPTDRHAGHARLRDAGRASWPPPPSSSSAWPMPRIDPTLPSA